MTVVAVLADPPREGVVLKGLVKSSPISAAEAVRLYEALFRDMVRAVDRSASDLLVNYLPDESLPSEAQTDTAPEAELRAIVLDELDPGDEMDGVRFEPQVGSTFSARAGNTTTHLLEEEEATSVAIVRPNIPFIARTVLDSASMKLRQSDAVLGPAPDGRVHFAGFRKPIDFEAAWEPPALGTLTDRAVEDDLDVDFIPMQPVIETGRDLATAIVQMRSRIEAERIVPVNTATVLGELDIDVAMENGFPSLVSD